MGIDDRDSWLLREAYPSGHASGWRRTGCLVMLIGALLVIVVAAVIALVSVENDPRPPALVRWSSYEVSADGTTLMVDFFDPGCSGGYEFDHLEVVETDRSVRITSVWDPPGSGFCTMECPAGVHRAVVTLLEPLAGRVVQQFPASKPHCSEGLAAATARAELASLGSWP